MSSSNTVAAVAAMAVAAVTTAAAVGVIKRAIVTIAYESSPFTASCPRLLLSIIVASFAFAAIKSCYLVIALV